MKFGVYLPNFGPYGDPRALADSEESVHLVQQRADLGATWWLESITPFRGGAGYEDEWPVDLMRERILLGPPQLDEHG